MTKAFFIILLIASCTLLRGQDLRAVKGRVVSNLQPIEFANVYLAKSVDTLTVVNATVTNADGTFLLDGVKGGEFLLRIQMVGYKRLARLINVDISRKPLDLGTLELEPDTVLLKTVEVVGARDLVQKTDLGFVFNATENLTQIGGTAADLLKNMPGVLVDAEGAITLRGKSPLTLINGRVSGITGVDRTAQLQRIPASSIERIEIINNPGAKYDADSEGGIINIILKKNHDEGTNGAFAVGAGHGDRYRLNASVLLNHKTGKWNFGGAYDNWYTTRTRSITGDRINYLLPEDYYLKQRRFDERLVFYQNAKANIDFTPSDKSSLNFEALWAFPGENNNETLTNTLIAQDENITGINRRHSNEIRRSHALELAMSYVKKLKNPDQAFNLSLSDAFENGRENTDIDTQDLDQNEMPVGDPRLQRTHVYEKTNLLNIAPNFTSPLSQNGMLDVGLKSIFRHLKSDFERSDLSDAGIYIPDQLFTNIFTFDEQIHAAYAEWTGWTGDKSSPSVKFNVGLRAEQAWNKGKTVDESTDFKNEYFNLFPSGSLFLHSSANTTLKLIYSRRINRPGLGQLNPFIDITDSLNQHSGNSRLRPELIHSLELGFDRNWQKVTLSVSGFYRLRNNAIYSFTQIDENGVALSRPANFGKATTAGVEAVSTFNVSAAWNINLSVSALNVDISQNGVALPSTLDLNWYSKLINNVSLSKSAKLQLIAAYTSPTTTPQGETIPVYYVDLGIQQRVLADKGRIGVTVTDIFNTQKYGSVVSGENFDSKRTGKVDTRAFMITFGYTFGTSFKDKLMENRFKNE